MRKLFIITSLLILYCSVWAQYKFKVMPNNSFREGEELVYSLHYGFITGGEATLSLEEDTLSGESLYHGRAIARTVGVADKLFNVKDIYESYFLKDTGLPVKAIRDIHEGNYKYYNEVTFNRDSNTVTSQKSGIHKMPENIMDMVSVLYFIRRLDYASFKNGDAIKIDTYFGDELFPFEIRFRGTETVKTKLGKFRCYKFVPIVEPGRIFENEDDMTIWITKDENLIPVMISFNMIVGSIKCELIGYKNLRHPISPPDK